MTDPKESILPSPAHRRSALRRRDAAYNGRFFVAQATSGAQLPGNPGNAAVFCTPTCERRGSTQRVAAFASAGAAHDAGLVPCPLCQPLLSPRTPDWVFADGLVPRALRAIEAGHMGNGDSGALAETLGVDQQFLLHSFQQQLGTSPLTQAKLQRAALAWQLLCRSGISLQSTAFHAGHRNVGQLRRELLQVYGCTPGEIRAQQTARSRSAVQIVLPVRLPYHFDWVFSYLQKRALAGVEEAGQEETWYYRRRISQAPERWLYVRPHESGAALVVHAPIGEQGEPLYSLLSRVRRVFDVHGDGASVHKFMRRQVPLAGWAKVAPGLRVPGAWDGFETAVRAILGQQVSVARGTELANKMIQQYGGGCFPAPQQLLHREVAELGMPGRRGRAIVYLAELVDAGAMQIEDWVDFDHLQQRLQAIDGIGPWTANYIRMRALKDADAFPDNDWVVLKQLQCTAAKARQAARAWQPWRAYALMYLWYAAGHKGNLAAATAGNT